MEESDLYCPIRKRLEKEGYFSFVTAGAKGFKSIDVCHRGEFPIRFESLERKPDLVGFRWDSSGDLDAVAIEVKKGDTQEAVSSGLGAALIYQKFFPRVLIGMESYSSTADEGVLDLYDLGWITPNKSSIPESTNPLFNNEVYEEIRRFGKLALVFKDLIGEPSNPLIDEYPKFEYYLIGRNDFPDGTHYRWICAYFIGVQYTIIKWNTSGQFTINIEHKSVSKSVMESIKKNQEKFKQQLNLLKGFNFHFSRLFGVQMQQEENIFDKPCPEIDLDELLSGMERLLVSKTEKPYVRIYKEIWGKDENLTKDAIQKRMKGARQALRNIYLMLK
jgi:hypothetical protein